MIVKYNSFQGISLIISGTSSLNMLSDNVLVKTSTIHGKGVFSSRNFKKGEVVLHWDISHIISEEVVEKMSNEEKKYISFLNNIYVMMQEPERFVNHSCVANTTAKDFCDIAKRDIAKGEEITADYSEELPQDAYLECHCGNKNCRRIIRR